MRAHVLFLVLAALSPAVHAGKRSHLRNLADDGHDHDHDHGHEQEEEHEEEHGHEGGHGWAWAGVFNLEADHAYTWSCARGANGEYAAAHLEFLMVPVSGADHEGLEEGEELAEGLWDDPNATAEVEQGETVPSGSFVHLELHEDSWLSVFQVSPDASGAYAVFTAHPPAEFENGFHYFKDSHGHDVEPVLSEGGEDGHQGHDHGEHAEEVTEQGGKLGEVIAAAVLIALPSLVLIAGVGPGLQVMQRYMQEPVAMYAFASGAVLACAVFLLFPEGYLLASAGKSETDATWTWGVCILAGWLLCVLIHWLCCLAFPKASDDDAVICVTPSPANGDVQAEKTERQPVDWAVAGPVLLGDFWHNLVDGMVVGFAAKHCSGTMTWTIVAVTVAHELPQEISDFLVLVMKAKMWWRWAALLNFASGLAAVLGAIVAYEATVDANFQGLSLTFGGGVYLFIAMTELGPAMMSKASAQECVTRFCAFALGATCVGLVLLGHEHCSAPGSSHAGHDHR